LTIGYAMSRGGATAFAVLLVVLAIAAVVGGFLGTKSGVFPGLFGLIMFFQWRQLREGSDAKLAADNLALTGAFILVMAALPALAALEAKLGW
jgi:hypothetical protein